MAFTTSHAGDLSGGDGQIVGVAAYHSPSMSATMRSARAWSPVRALELDQQGVGPVGIVDRHRGEAGRVHLLEPVDQRLGLRGVETGTGWRLRPRHAARSRSCRPACRRR